MKITLSKITGDGFGACICLGVLKVFFVNVNFNKCDNSPMKSIGRSYLIEYALLPRFNALKHSFTDIEACGG